jgi:DNA replication and repair protein RecF
VFFRRIELRDFRNYESVDVEFPESGLVIVQGRNGQGKTNLLEAISYATTLRSFRAPTTNALVRVGSPSAVVRAWGERARRELQIEAEITEGSGRNRTLVNKQPLRRTADMADVMTSVVFAPDDLSLVKGGPALRREYVDGVLADADRRVAALQHDVDRVLKQRNTLLRQAGGRLSTDIATTLDVWDQRLTDFGETLGDERDALVCKLHPLVTAAYADVAEDRRPAPIELKMLTDWRVQDGGKGLGEALRAARSHDIARGTTTVGPHRDELHMAVGGLPARTHASQGEQRTFALALRLAAFRHLTSVKDASPILLLDDVFSELDDERAHRLLTHLSSGQVFLSTAIDPPDGFTPALTLHVDGGLVQ